MLTHDALDTYVADRRQAREQAASTARLGRLLRRARPALGATGPTGSAATPVPAPTTAPARTTDLPAAAHATGASAGSDGDPAVAVLRTTATAGDPRAA
ncbi:MAG TPA: hypothetical protein VFU19_20210 [Iamia sp.]|nr:hypothetical protein [Iamia sp.]